MKKFRFKLATLLKVTEMNKEKAQAELALATRKLQQARDDLHKLLGEMAQGQKDYDTLTAKGGIRVGTLMSYNSFFNWKRGQIEAKQQEILLCQNEKQIKVRALLEVSNKLKSIEQLREKQLAKYMAEFFQEEQKQLDEIGNQLYFRNQQGGEGL